jgi:hypothetical protein
MTLHLIHRMEFTCTVVRRFTYPHSTSDEGQTTIHMRSERDNKGPDCEVSYPVVHSYR